MPSFENLRVVDNFYQTSLFFPMPTVVVSTLCEDGSTSLGPYSLVAPYYIAGKDYYAMLRCMGEGEQCNARDGRAHEDNQRQEKQGKEQEIRSKSRGCMYDFSIPMAIMDYVPVFFFGITMLILQWSLYASMYKGAYALLAAGTINIFFAGFLKATWKLFYAAGLCDFYLLNDMFLPFHHLR